MKFNFKSTKNRIMDINIFDLTPPIYCVYCN